MAKETKRILITGARFMRALEMARQLHELGHQVFAADSLGWFVTQTSNAVEKSFTVPSPRFESDAFFEALVEIIQKYQIDLVLPVFEEAFYLAKYYDQWPKTCEVFVESLDKMVQLHNKHKFTHTLQTYGFPIPETHLIKSEEDLLGLKKEYDYALKPIYSGASTNIIRYHPGDPLPKLDIHAPNYWIAQQWLDGPRFCSYSICHKGKVRALSLYPVSYSIDDYSCVYFESVRHEAITEWITDFVGKIEFTGQIGFDFIIQDNIIYIIDCNPRLTSGAHLFSVEDGIDKALFNQTDQIIMPKENVKKQILIGMLLYGRHTSKKLVKPNQYLNTLLHTPNVIFSRHDLKPGIMQFFGFIYYLWYARKLKLTIPQAIVYDLEWNG